MSDSECVHPPDWKVCKFDRTGGSATKIELHILTAALLSIQSLIIAPGVVKRISKSELAEVNDEDIRKAGLTEKVGK